MLDGVINHRSERRQCPDRNGDMYLRYVSPLGSWGGPSREDLDRGNHGTHNVGGEIAWDLDPSMQGSTRHPRTDNYG